MGLGAKVLLPLDRHTSGGWRAQPDIPRCQSCEFLLRIATRWTVLLVASVALVWTASFLPGPHRGASPVLAAELKPIQLPNPEITGGMPLMPALAARRTTRAFADKPLPPQTLSNLLWAAFGVNRSRAVKSDLGRTAPSAYNRQDITLEVVLADGVYIYDAEANLLRPVLSGDVRGVISPAPAAHAAVTIVYLAPAKDDFAQVDCRFHRPKRVPVRGVGEAERVVLHRACAGCRRKAWALAPIAAFCTLSRWGIRRSNSFFVPLDGADPREGWRVPGGVCLNRISGAPVAEVSSSGTGERTPWQIPCFPPKNAT